MKKAFLLFVLLLLAFFSWTTPVDAVCRNIAATGVCNADEFRRDHYLTIGGTAQCTGGTNGPHTVCCETQTEANALDSVRAPMCGSSQELGKNNSSCWSCDDGSLRCSGSDFALGETDDALFLNREAIDGGDSSQVWRVTQHPPTFKFNGVDYTHNGDLIMCTSNNKACGASNTQCTGLYPEDDQPPGAVAPIVVPGETNFANIVVVKDFDKGLWDGIAALGGTQVVLSQAGRVKPHENVLKNPSPFLENMGRAMFKATSFALKPLTLQERTVDAKNCQKYEVTGIVCVYDNKDGRLLNTDPSDQVKSTEAYESIDCNPAAKNERRQGIESLAAITAKYTKEDQNYEKPPLAIKVDEPLGCEIIDPTASLSTDQIASQKENKFPIDTQNIILNNVSLIGIFDSILTRFFKRATVKIIVRETILDKYEADPYCLGPGCDDAEAISRVKYPLEQEKVDMGGAFRSFQPNSHDFKGTIHGGEETQEFDADFWGTSVEQSPTAYSYANREEIGGNYVYCMISPLKNNHLGLFNNGECNRNWKREEAPRQPPPVNNIALGNNIATQDPRGNVQPSLGRSGEGISLRRPDGTINNEYMKEVIRDTAQEANIPMCVLEAVGMIEGAFNWGEKDDNPAQCVPNRCGAAGPFQITTGRNGNNSSCAISCPEAGYCPNAWGNTAGTPCNIGASAQFAANKLKNDPENYDGLPVLNAANYQSQEASIRSAAYHYYGSHAAQSSLPYNGKNLSYEEFVLEHCRLFPNGE